MGANKHWEILPGLDFADMASWRRVAAHRFTAIRVVLFVNRSAGSKSRYGPIISGHNVNPGDTITVRRRHERVVSNISTVTEAIRYAATARVMHSLDAKLSAQLKASAPGYSGTVGGELVAGTQEEFTSTLGHTLGGTSSFQIQETDETEHQIVLKGASEAREAHLRRRFWPNHWDVYLTAVEYIELEYRREWLWRQVRNTIRRAAVADLKLPLCRITFYEPQLDLDVTYAGVQDELEDPEAVTVEPLTRAMPAAIAPNLESLDKLASVAFPTNRAEREEKLKHFKKKAARKMVGRERAFRARGGPRKGARKRALTRKTARKRANKRASRKRAGKTARKR